MDHKRLRDTIQEVFTIIQTRDADKRTREAAVGIVRSGCLLDILSGNLQGFLG